MSYSVHNLLTVEDCDIVIGIANKEKRNLLHKKGNISFTHENYSEENVDIAGETITIQSQIDAQDIIINNLPAGEAKNKEIIKKKKLEYKMLLLTERKANYGAVALLDKELDLTRTESELADVESFVLEIEQHKAKL